MLSWRRSGCSAGRGCRCARDSAGGGGRCSGSQLPDCRLQWTLADSIGTLGWNGHLAAAGAGDCGARTALRNAARAGVVGSGRGGGRRGRRRSPIRAGDEPRRSRRRTRIGAGRFPSAADRGRRRTRRPFPRLRCDREPPLHWTSSSGVSARFRCRLLRRSSIGCCRAPSPARRGSSRSRPGCSRRGKSAVTLSTSRSSATRCTYR